MLWALQDPRNDQLLVLERAYFERPEPTVWDEGGTYVETDRGVPPDTESGVRHGLGEIVTALRRPDDHEPGGARQRPVGRPAGSDGTHRR